MKKDKLIFSWGNAKLPKYIVTFSLPAGYSCKFAKECLAFADKKTGYITDGKDQTFRCYSASQEALYPNVRKNRWHNFNLLKKCKNKKEIIELIEYSLPDDFLIMRIGVSGDFFSQDYFDAWLEIAKKHSDKVFYCYTKAITYWTNRLGQIPLNFKLNASLGAKKII